MTTRHLMAFLIPTIFATLISCTSNSDTVNTTAAVPTVTTAVVSTIGTSTASGGGDVTADGGASVTDKGICWSTTANPTVSDSHTSDGTDTGAFTSAMTGLTQNTTYHVRAFATNSVGTAYGSDQSFTTANPAVTYTLTISVSPASTGTVTTSPATGPFASGTTVTLTATPATGYQFKQWSGTDAASVTANQIVMNGNKSLTAEFEAVAGARWVPMASPNSSGLFRQIYVSGNEAWLLNNNAIYYSSNYPSVPFSSIYTPSNTLNAFAFFIQGSNKYGWAVGNSSLGAMTTDGTTWSQMSLGGTSNYQCISFPTTLLGFASGTDKRLHKTTNGGLNWSDAGPVGFGTANTLFFLDANTGYVGTSDPRLAKTTNGGATWVDVGDITGTIMDIFFLDSSHGWAVGASDILRYDGSTWTQINNTTGYPLYSVFFISPTEGWACGNGGTIIHTTDGGATWTPQNSGTTATLRDIFFTSPTNGYAVGNNGTILRFTDQ